MLIEFKVGNYLSFKDETVLSMVASSDKDTLPNNVIEPDGSFKQRLLKSAVIYGANASGKSNFLKAMYFMHHFVKNSVEGDHETKINVTPFVFDETCKQQPSLFEIDFLLEGIRFIYGFRVDNEKVHDEWLYSYPKGQQVRIFERFLSNNIYKYEFNRGLKKELGDFEKKTRHNSLLLTVATQFNNEIASNINSVFWAKLRMISLMETSFLESLIFSYLVKEMIPLKSLIDCLSVADFGIANISFADNRFDQDFQLLKNALIDVLKKETTAIGKLTTKLIEEVEDKDIEPVFYHLIKNDEGGNVEMPLDFKFESDGTREFFVLIGYILLSHKEQLIPIADELDLGLHPMLSRWLIDFFHNYKKESKAQLIFTTHNTDIMDPKLFRRDQIWFTAKDRATGASTLFSLSDYKRRKGENYRKNYLEGRYGAIPILEKFDGLELKEESR